MNKDDRDNVVPISSSSAEGQPLGGGNGGGGGFGERLARIEERVKHLATSEDLQKVVTSVEKMRGELNIIKWIFGIFVIAIISASVRSFFGG